MAKCYFNDCYINSDVNIFFSVGCNSVPLAYDVTISLILMILQELP